jgi:hypothetical protein
MIPPRENRYAGAYSFARRFHINSLSILARLLFTQTIFRVDSHPLDYGIDTLHGITSFPSQGTFQLDIEPRLNS